MSGYHRVITGSTGGYQSIISRVIKGLLCGYYRVIRGLLKGYQRVIKTVIKTVIKGYLLRPSA